MRVLITGSRTWTDEDLIRDVLAVYWHLHGSAVVLVSGACKRGADAMAERWAQLYGWTVERHPADWAQHGKAAGHRRNAAMVARGAGLCLAFIHNNSPGATKCATMAHLAGIKVQTYRA